MNLFGKKKAAPPKLNDSIQQLREAMVTLEKREKHLEKQRDLTVQEARKKVKAKDKRGAVFQLKRKKLFDKQIDQIYGKKTNIEMQIMALESASSNKEILGVMKMGKDALQGAIKESDVDKIGDVMEDINESIQLADELGDAMSNPLGPPVDEDELTAELEQMESEMMDEDLLKVPDVPVVKPVVQDTTKSIVADAPKVPVGIKKNESQDEKEARELRELEALMNA